MIRRFSFLTVTALLVALSSSAHAAKGDLTITWLGHAAFEIVTPGETNLLIDPFLSKNPTTPTDRKDLGKYKPAAILLTHSHFDHTDDAVAIAKKSKAKVIGASDHIKSLGLPEAQVGSGNVGGVIAVGDAKIHLVPAMHGSDPGGRALGFVIELADGRRIYHTGDTWIFGDMALVQEIYKPTILLFQVGGGPYNQSPEVAALAIKKYFEPETIVPMHYGTWPQLASEAQVRTAFAGDKRLRVLKAGLTWTVTR